MCFPPEYPPITVWSWEFHFTFLRASKYFILTFFCSKFKVSPDEYICPVWTWLPRSKHSLTAPLSKWRWEVIWCWGAYRTLSSLAYWFCFSIMYSINRLMFMLARFALSLRGVHFHILSWLKYVQMKCSICVCVCVCIYICI